MRLRSRLAIAFALVALVTAGLIVLATPTIVGRGFARLEADAVDTGSGIGTGPGMGAGQGAGRGAGQGMGQGAGNGPGPMAGLHAQQVQEETTLTLVALALVAAAGASLLGVFLAGRIVRPLDTLESAAAAVAHGDLTRRSGLGDRADELGSLGRSFDAMTDELAAAEDARRRFFADAAHELKTPLSVIDATTSALLDGVYEREDRHLLTIRDQSHLLGRIVDDLRTVSLAETQALPLRLEPVALDGLIRASVGEMTIRAESAGVRLRADDLPAIVVTADRDRLRQVLAALLDNALRHTPSGGEIFVRAAVAGDAGHAGAVRVDVADTGPGVDPADLPHLFDRFYQADPARDRTTGTSGLGLAVVRALVLAHGGRVGAENTPGGGARFWFELPAAGPDTTTPETAVHPRPIGSEVTT